MGDKFIPNGDFDFATMAEHFARTIANDPARVNVSQTDADALSAAVVAFRAALNMARGASRSTVATHEKETARGEAERIIRRIANTIRGNDQIDSVSKVVLNLRDRPTKVKQQSCPKTPPRLTFVRALHERGATPMHELEFSDPDARSSKKPDGAVRLELFVDLIPPDEPTPNHPGANHNGRPWYLRSFTRSPIILTPPMTRVPMRVIYWGRWADSIGNVGPFSATAVAWIEGGSHGQLPGGIDFSLPGGRNLPPLLEDISPSTTREPRISVVLVEAQYRSMNPSLLSHEIEIRTPQLPAPAEHEAA